MTAKSVLVRPQDLRPGARAPTCPPLLRHWMSDIDSKTTRQFSC